MANKIQARNWERMGLQKAKGRMGFRDLESFNLAILAKQLRRMIQKPLSIVDKVYRGKNTLRVLVSWKPNWGDVHL